MYLIVHHVISYFIISLCKIWNWNSLSSSALPKFLEECYEDTIYLNIGQAKALEIPYSGNPNPKVTWSFNNSALPDKKRFKEETIYGMTCVRMSKVTRTDSGSYRVTLENDVGFCEYLIKVVVMSTYRTVVIFCNFHPIKPYVVCISVSLGFRKKLRDTAQIF